MATGRRLTAARALRSWPPHQLAGPVRRPKTDTARHETDPASLAPELKDAIARELGIATWEVAL